MSKSINRVASSAIIALSIVTMYSQIPNSLKKKGLVTKRDVAVSIAQIILEDVYGKEQIARQLPFQVTELKASWIIEGTLKANRVGGVAKIKISKTDCRVLEIIHGK